MVRSTGLSKYELRGVRPRRLGHNRGPPLDPLAVTVAEAKRLTGLGLTTIWKLIAEKELETVHVGRRTLVIFASLRRLLSPNDDTQERRHARRAAVT
jgi:excisionase family DNA binding protein